MARICPNPRAGHRIPGCCRPPCWVICNAGEIINCGALALQRIVFIYAYESIIMYPVIDAALPPPTPASTRGSLQADYHYQTLRCNVDLLKIIQLGLTFADDDGVLADSCPTWQFNFKFNLQEDMYAQDSIDLLTRSGIEFREHEERGIDVAAFGELLISSGLVLTDDVIWISFHSGYDFGYLLKLLTAAPLPGARATAAAANAAPSSGKRGTRYN